MIEIKTRPFSLEVEGHAGFDVPGRDIVCAAVSTLLCALAMSVEEEMERAHVCGSHISLNEGRAIICAEPVPEYECAFALLFETFSRALCALAEEYPEYIRILPDVDKASSPSCQQNGRKEIV